MNTPSIDHYRATPHYGLGHYDTLPSDHFRDKQRNKKILKGLRKKISEFQNRLYAHGRYAVLICFQGMDTAGKDSLIREVFKQCNVRGVKHHSFKKPTKLELSHNFLWRHHLALPPKGKFGIFNRTHYENVLVTRVHPQYVLSENLPDIKEVNDIDAEFWKNRFKQIKQFEEGIHRNGTIVLKFFLHLSKGEQKRRLLRRLDEPEKNWKFSPDDLNERALWDKYQFCYEEAIQNTHTENAPWYVIPADDKPFARMLVATILNQRLQAYDDIQNPEISVDTGKLQQYRERLLKED